MAFLRGGISLGIWHGQPQVQVDVVYILFVHMYWQGYLALGAAAHFTVVYILFVQMYWQGYLGAAAHFTVYIVARYAGKVYVVCILFLQFVVTLGTAVHFTLASSTSSRWWAFARCGVSSAVLTWSWTM